MNLPSFLREKKGEDRLTKKKAATLTKTTKKKWSKKCSRGRGRKKTPGSILLFPRTVSFTPGRGALTEERKGEGKKERDRPGKDRGRRSGARKRVSCTP